MSRWLLLAVLLSAAVAGPLARPAGAAEGDLQVRVEGVDASAFPQVRATVTVLDGEGRPIAGLPPEAFRASAAAQVVPVSGVAGATDQGLPIAVVLAFDVSGSMAGEPLAQAKEAGKLLVDQLGPADQVAVVAFSDDVSVVQPLTGDRDALAGAVDGLFVGGNTA
ncbi:MAG TPA: VWA domain-containing protein, partial [Dehalococcoidia bacterium]|nr:VWA domain-containing protein [Dehalococcoidia bacterium]